MSKGVVTGEVLKTNEDFDRTGIVKWFNASKGFGFIKEDDSDGPDIFVHCSDITGSVEKVLFDGDKVTFRVTTGKKGLKAADVRVTH